MFRVMPHCVTCTCQSWFEIATHHVLQVLVLILGVAGGILLANVVQAWLITR